MEWLTWCYFDLHYIVRVHLFGQGESIDALGKCGINYEKKVSTVMVNNSTNINKRKNHLSPKDSLNSDGQKFHQYQQNDQSPSLTEHTKRHMTLEIQILIWEKHKHVAGLCSMTFSKKTSVE